MTIPEWKAFLATYNRELLDCSEIGRDLPKEVVESGWLGFAPASAGELSEAEQRLAARLPPSLKNFYLVTNGWRTTGFFVWEILPVGRIGWLRDLIPVLYHIAVHAEQEKGPFKNDADDRRLNEYRYKEGTRVKRSLVINLEGDASNWLLDPGAVDEAGEWAAGRWSSWNPGMEWLATSFASLMQHELDGFRKLRDKPSRGGTDHSG